MNRLHRWYCRSDHWRAVVTRDLFGWTLGDAVLGDDLLELGPGPGVTTTLLARVAQQVTTVDIDLRRPAPAPMSNVRHVRGDATRLPFQSSRFSAVAAFTMLHHVRGAASQRQLLHESSRVLRPGGVFIGCDVRASLPMRIVHLGGTFEPVPPARLAADLRAAGFTRVAITEGPRYLKWHACLTS